MKGSIEGRVQEILYPKPIDWAPILGIITHIKRTNRDLSRLRSETGLPLIIYEHQYQSVKDDLYGIYQIFAVLSGVVLPFVYYSLNHLPK